MQIGRQKGVYIDPQCQQIFCRSFFLPKLYKFPFHIHHLTGYGDFYVPLKKGMISMERCVRARLHQAIAMPLRYRSEIKRVCSILYCYMQHWRLRLQHHWGITL